MHRVWRGAAHVPLSERGGEPRDLDDVQRVDGLARLRLPPAEEDQPAVHLRNLIIIIIIIIIITTTTIIIILPWYLGLIDEDLCQRSAREARRRRERRAGVGGRAHGAQRFHLRPRAAVRAAHR